MNDTHHTPRDARWDLAAEAIALKMRWFGVVIGVLLVETRAGGPTELASPGALRAILALGAIYAAVDTYYSVRGRIFLQDLPLVVSLLEAVFIGLLCHFDLGLDSPFRFYFMMSLVSAAIRYDRKSTYFTCLLHCSSYAAVALDRPLFPPGLEWTFPLTLIVMLWVTWASSSLAELLKRAGADLERLNVALRENETQLNDRIAEAARELHEAQASLLHQEKMAAFGLLAAGIAHEVGNPLTSISALVQMLARRHTDAYTQEKLSLVEGQLTRIQGTLRELVNFSRPAALVPTQADMNHAIGEALSIAKYYKRTKSKRIETEFAAKLPPIFAPRDQLVQVFLNLVLNAIDATDKDGCIRLTTREVDGRLEARVFDNGSGIRDEDRPKIFQPYYTTKDHGTGLGLFVCRKIVTDLGGSIEFESTPDTGTTFSVRLPMSAVRRESPLESAAPQRVPADALESVGQPVSTASI